VQVGADGGGGAEGGGGDGAVLFVDALVLRRPECLEKEGGGGVRTMKREKGQRAKEDRRERTNSPPRNPAPAPRFPETWPPSSTPTQPA